LPSAEEQGLIEQLLTLFPIADEESFEEEAEEEESEVEPLPWTPRSPPPEDVSQQRSIRSDIMLTYM